jgi:hypothetical protein
MCGGACNPGLKECDATAAQKPAQWLPTSDPPSHPVATVPCQLYYVLCGVSCTKLCVLSLFVHQATGPTALGSGGNGLGYVEAFPGDKMVSSSAAQGRYTVFNQWLRHWLCS